MINMLELEMDRIINREIKFKKIDFKKIVDEGVKEEIDRFTEQLNRELTRDEIRDIENDVVEYERMVILNNYIKSVVG